MKRPGAFPVERKRSDFMKRLFAAVIIILLSGGLGNARTPPGSTKPAPGPTNPNIVSPNETTVGQAPGVNPVNLQDQTNRAPLAGYDAAEREQSAGYAANIQVSLRKMPDRATREISTSDNGDGPILVSAPGLEPGTP
jgi:hypothetical protein